MNSVKAIIPFKKKEAKSRLRTFFTGAEREKLAIRMLKDVLVALSESKIEEVEIISTCSKEELLNELKLELRNLKLTVRVDEKGLTEVLNEVIKDETEPRLIIMADIPLVTPESINEIIGHEADVVIAPGRKGGTNALFMRRPCEFVVSYYGVSCLEHIEMAKRRNLSYTVHDSFFISADIDEEDDLMELLIHGKSYSAEYLRMIGVFIHVDKKTKVRAKVDRYDEKTETFITSTSSSFFEVKGKKMELEGVEIEDTFAEAFPIKVARVLITAVNEKWAMTAAREMTGFGTSVIMCPAEAGIDKIAAPEETPDGRPGVYAMICTFGYKALDEQLLARIGQCILTSPTAAVFNAMAESEKEFNTGFKLKFFGDGFESEEELDGREVVRVPIMGGEFVIEKNLGAKAGVAGGNIFILAKDQMAALTAAEDAVDAIQEVEGTITPFTGGVVASGSKPSSNRYKFMHATINEKFCPTLKDKIEDTELPADVNGVFEIVINGVSEDAVKEAMKAGIKAAVKVPGVVKITAGNFGGKLGKYQLRLKDVLGL